MEDKQIPAVKSVYDENFYRLQKDGSFKSATKTLPVITKFVKPQSVVDIGCGVGTWLAVWHKNLGADVYGLDGDYVDRAQLFINEKDFRPANLEERITLERRFDLAMTLEVAEHLSPARADSFVEDLTKLSDVILFSAAIPAQGGTNHVNEQWQSYWAQKFSRFGYVAIDCIRPEIWNDQDIAWWYRQNMILYVRYTELYRYCSLQEFYLTHRDSMIFDAVHPETFLNINNRLRKRLKQTQTELAEEKRIGGGRLSI